MVSPHLDDALSLARWLTGNRDDAEDVVQEACLRAFNALRVQTIDNLVRGCWRSSPQEWKLRGWGTSGSRNEKWLYRIWRGADFVYSAVSDVAEQDLEEFGGKVPGSGEDHVNSGTNGRQVS